MLLFLLYCYALLLTGSLRFKIAIQSNKMKNFILKQRSKTLNLIKNRFGFCKHHFHISWKIHQSITHIERLAVLIKSGSFSLSHNPFQQICTLTSLHNTSQDIMCCLDLMEHSELFFFLNLTEFKKIYRQICVMLHSSKWTFAGQTTIRN